MTNRWVLHTDADEQTVQKLAQSQKIPESIAKILISRGVTTPEDAQNFFFPSLSALHSPFLMDDMEKAVDRIEKAIANGELIWIYGDYDVDGTVSTAMLYHFMREIGAKVEYHIPDRFSEGYGLSPEGIRLAKKSGISLILCVDTGVTAIEHVKLANELGIDFIICDHHEPADSLPPAYAILDPIKGNCPYPFKFLCAGGVVFKLIHAICISRGESDKAFNYIDLAGIATAADMVPIIGENRIFLYFGVKRLNQSPRPGLLGLMNCTNVEPGKVTSSNIVYLLAPRLNAAGRLGDASRSVRLLLEEDGIEAFRLAQDLESQNHQRRVIDEDTFVQATKMAEDMIHENSVRSLVLHNPDWHVGVINIVASRIVEKFYLPTIMLTSIENVAKGSARSIKNFDIHSAIKQCQNLVIQFGGHKYASGLSLEEHAVPAFRKAFDIVARAIVSDDMLVPELHIEAAINFGDITPIFYELIRRFEPYGYHNSNPIFMTNNVFLVKRANIVGKNHLKFRARQDSVVFDVIGFSLGDYLSLVNSGRPLSIVYTIEETTFGTKTITQLSLKDVRLSKDLKM